MQTESTNNASPQTDAKRWRRYCFKRRQRFRRHRTGERHMKLPGIEDVRITPSQDMLTLARRQRVSQSLRQFGLRGWERESDQTRVRNRLPDGRTLRSMPKSERQKPSQGSYAKWGRIKANVSAWLNRGELPASLQRCVFRKPEGRLESCMKAVAARAIGSTQPFFVGCDRANLDRDRRLWRRHGQAIDCPDRRAAHWGWGRSRLRIAMCFRSDRAY
jgi:hypothetical protein